MKRSEMIKDILWWLNDQLYTVDDSGEGDIHPQCADDLLAMIEKAGMLPPKSLDTVCVKKGLVRGYTQMFEWEPEEEENEKK